MKVVKEYKKRPLISDNNRKTCLEEYVINRLESNTAKEFVDVAYLNLNLLIECNEREKALREELKSGAVWDNDGED